MSMPALIRQAFRRPAPHLCGGKSPPELSGGLPGIGHTMEFMRSAVELLFRARAELGEVASFRVAHKRMVLLTGPDAQRAVFRAPDSQLSPSAAYTMMAPVFGKDIVYDAPSEKMNEQLRMLLPALQDRRMRTYGRIIVREVERSVVDWGDEGEIDVVDYCRILTNFTSSHCLLGPEFREEMTDEFARVYHDLERGITPAAYISPHLPLPWFVRRDRARARLVEMIAEIVDERRTSGHVGEDFLQTLMEARYSDGRALTDHEITGLLLASMFAGHHTSSVGTAFTLLELLQNPHYLDEVLEQLFSLYGEDGEVTHDSLRESTLSEYAVKEVLRLHPPLFMLMRGVMEDFEYKDFLIPEGSFVVVSPAVAHRIPEVFPHPHSFDPRRFAPGREEDRIPFAYIAFGGGRHKCLGNAFALLQIKAILAVLLRKYTFELTTDPITSDFHGLVVGPRQPCRVRYRRRTHPFVSRGMPSATRKETGAGVATPFHVQVDRDLCQGHSACASEAPGVFRLENQRAVALVAEPDEAERPKVRAAARYCPTGAIQLTPRKPD